MVLRNELVCSIHFLVFRGKSHSQDNHEVELALAKKGKHCELDTTSFCSFLLSIGNNSLSVFLIFTRLQRRTVANGGNFTIVI